MARRMTVADRRRNTFLMAVAVATGVGFAAGMVVAVWSCSNLPAILTTLSHSAWTFGIVFLVVWFARAFIAAFVAAIPAAIEQADINKSVDGKIHFWHM